MSFYVTAAGKNTAYILQPTWLHSKTLNAFNEFFTNVSPTLDNDIPIATNHRDPSIYLSSKVPHSLLLAPTTSHELSEIISNLDDSKSSGPSSIPTKLLKLVREMKFPPLLVKSAIHLLLKKFSLTKTKYLSIKKAPLMMLITIVLHHFYLMAARLNNSGFAFHYFS